MRVRDVRDDGVAVCEDGRRLDGAPAEPVEVMIDLVAPVEPGDELLVHAGVALTRLT